MSAVTVITLTPDELRAIVREEVARAQAAPALAPPAGYLSIRDAATTLGVSEDSIRRMIQAGKLRASRVGGGRGAWRIARADLEAALAEEPPAPVDPGAIVVDMIRRRR